MKKSIITIILALASVIIAAAQSTNPLNYSGKMYIEAMVIISTPRYVSYEDHAILSEEERIPMMQVTKCVLDFQNGSITAMDTQMAVKVNTTKKYTTDTGWVVVIYMDMPDEGDKAELVWPEFEKPYFQQITETGNGVNIASMVLTSIPYVADESEVLMNLLQGMGTL